ncbi:hypothetical protein EON68_01005 [archaeon]|nr:MAG: hypothetical protein EON68_01005 [archaeon]
MAAASTGACDAMVFVVNVGQEASIEYFRRSVEKVPNHVPCVVVVTPHESRSDALLAGFETLKRVCSSAESVDLLAPLEGEGAASAGASTVASSSGSARLPGTSAADLPTRTCGLNLPLFDFKPTNRTDKSYEIFRYVSLLSVTPDMDNPATAARRASSSWSPSLAAVLLGGLVVAAAAATAAYFGNRTVRESVDNTLARVSAAVRRKGGQ